jgi:hypothetical protein
MTVKEVGTMKTTNRLSLVLLSSVLIGFVLFPSPAASEGIDEVYKKD